MNKIILFDSYLEPVKDLSDEEAGRLFKAILSPEEDPKEILSGMAYTAYLFIKARVDEENAKRETRAAISRENGKKGGRPKKTEEAGKKEETPPSPTEEKPKPKDKKPKEQKPKEVKKQYAEYVFMKEKEYEKLVEEYGEAAVKWMIEKLDNFKGATGKRYKDDYRAILNWVVRAYKEEKGKTAQPIRSSPDTDDDWEKFYRGEN